KSQFTLFFGQLKIEEVGTTISHPEYTRSILIKVGGPEHPLGDHGFHSKEDRTEVSLESQLNLGLRFLGIHIFCSSFNQGAIHRLQRGHTVDHYADIIQKVDLI